MGSILGKYGDQIISELSEIFKTGKKREKTGKQQYADCVIRNDKGEFLLLQRSYQDDFMAGKWCLAGGKIEEGEEPHVAASRELQEETGIEIDVAPLKTIEKDDCVIHYHEGRVSNDQFILLDNDEHYRYQFVHPSELPEYDMILDLNEVLHEQLMPILSPMYLPVNEQGEIFSEEMLVPAPIEILDVSDINKAFDAGMITDDDFLKYIERERAMELIKKGFDQDMVSPETFFNYLEKGKHYEFVQVNRGGKTFYQYREVGSNEIHEDVETGTSIETTADLGLKITKYSDKSILISGNTYKNLDLLREAKNQAGGYGSWNKALGGWIFPIYAKDKIMALIAQKMPIDTYDETKAKEAAIALKNSVDIGTEVTVDGEVGKVTEVTTNEAGKVEYTVETKEPEVKEADPVSMEEKKKIAYQLGYDSLKKDNLKAPIHDKELMGLSENPYNKDGIALMAAWNEGRQKALLNRSKETLEALKQKDEEERIAKEKELKEKEQREKEDSEVPIGTISPDGKYIKTADGWGWIKQEKKVTEEEVGIKPADEKKADELIGDATEENRFKVGKELFGKEEGGKSVSTEIEEAGAKEITIEAREFTARSGVTLSALDYTGVKHDDIQLADPETILDKPKPYYIPDINEYYFRNGYHDTGFVLSAVKIEGDNYIVALNGKVDADKTGYVGLNKKHDDKDNPNDYAVMSLDTLVATTEYYRAKRKAEKKKEAIEKNKSRVKDILTWNERQMEYYKPFNYTRLSEKQKKKYTEEAWNNLSVEDKLKEVPYMKKPVVSIESEQGRISVQKDNKMNGTVFKMYKKFVDKDYVIPVYSFKDTDPAYVEFMQTKQLLEYKSADMQIQKEENDSSYLKGKETSYGDSNVQDHLMETHGVKIKTQNGKEMKAEQIEQIRTNLTKVYESFGDRSSMAKEFGLKISHASERRMHASKALGVYIPSMKAIGVSNDPLFGKFGFTLAHEFAHFIDNYAGKKKNRYFASDDYSSTAGKIATLFRENMNQKGESDYINRTCECFARAFEQYHAMKHNGEDAIKVAVSGVPYHKEPEHVSKEKFNTLIKPLIEQFLKENDHLLKSAMDELNIIDINNNFEIIKAAYDADQIDLPTFLQYSEKYNDLVKGDPSHGGKLVKKTIIDKKGHKTTEWVKRDQAEETDKKKVAKEPVPHSKNVLSAFAKETPEKELKRVIAESHDENLRRAAHAELDRRNKKEKPQDKKEAKETDKKKDKVEPKKEEPKLEEKKDVEDGKAKPVKIKPTEEFKGKITLLKNTEKAPNMGARFGQDVEPSGFYCIQKETDHLDDHPNYKTFTMDIKKPLMVDVTDDLVQWKKDLSEKYKAKGKKLSEKLAKEGYDSIITTDKYGYTGEIIILNTEGLKEIDMKGNKK